MESMFKSFELVLLFAAFISVYLLLNRKWFATFYFSGFGFAFSVWGLDVFPPKTSNFLLLKVFLCVFGAALIVSALYLYLVEDETNEVDVSSGFNHAIIKDLTFYDFTLHGNSYVRVSYVLKSDEEQVVIFIPLYYMLIHERGMYAMPVTNLQGYLDYRRETHDISNESSLWPHIEHQTFSRPMDYALWGDIVVEYRRQRGI